MGNSTRPTEQSTLKIPTEFQFPVPLPNIEIKQQQRADDVFGLFETVSTAPTATPKTWFDQIKIYTNGATLRLYWYDATNATWHYITATA